MPVLSFIRTDKPICREHEHPGQAGLRVQGMHEESTQPKSPSMQT
jgi:hypothetical protein